MCHVLSCANKDIIIMAILMYTVMPHELKIILAK